MTAGPLVSTQWLADRLGQGGLRIADASWYLPQALRDPRAEYEAAHIPGAVFFDIDRISDPRTDLPHMLPDEAHFASAMGALGIAANDLVVLYDGAGLYSAPRALWMLRAMGHVEVAVLDGGLPKWRREGRRIERQMVEVTPVRYVARLRADFVRDLAAMRANIATQAEQVVDARSPSRFRGEEAEPRPGVKRGHMPGAINIHYAEVLDDEGSMRPPQELRRLFAKRRVDLEKPIVTSCGSGVTAAIVSLALELAGAKTIALYDGSWAEWGARTDVPILTGP